MNEFCERQMQQQQRQKKIGYVVVHSFVMSFWVLGHWSLVIPFAGMLGFVQALVVLAAPVSGIL